LVLKRKTNIISFRKKEPKEKKNYTHIFVDYFQNRKLDEYLEKYNRKGYVLLDASQYIGSDRWACSKCTFGIPESVIKQDEIDE
jgi:hypothetical protein